MPTSGGTADPQALPTRRAFLAGGAATLLGLRGTAAASAIERTVVEDWRQHARGARGIPAGWEPYPTPGGRPKYDLAVIDVDGRRALHLKSHGDRSTIARAVRVDLSVTPILEWNWKTVRLPDGADVRRSATSDLPAHLLIVWPRPPTIVRSRILAYAWDTTASAGTIVRSQKTSTVTFVIVRSGTAGLGRWLTERRDVHADYRAVYGEDPEPVQVIALSIDTNDTRAPAESFVGSITFRAPDR